MDGPFDVASSTRSEIGGFAAPMLLLTLLAQLWGMQHRCKLEWVCDSQAALTNVKKCTNWHRPQRYQPNNADLLSQIREATVRLRRPLKSTWIKGHQSGSKKVSPKMQLNITRNNRADELATCYRQQTERPQSKEATDHILASRVSISINGQRLVSHIEECIRYHVNGYHLRGYIQTKYKWTNRVWDTMDLLNFGRFRKHLPRVQTVRTYKGGVRSTNR